jgi:murein DD-endopeptidase MepM/ murein hydrolase activator NlpD
VAGVTVAFRIRQTTGQGISTAHGIHSGDQVVNTAKAPPDRARRHLVSRSIALVVGSLVVTSGVGVVSPGHSAAQGGPVHGGQERRTQENHQAELAMQLDAATATSEQLIAALTVIDQYAQSQTALANEAQRSQQDAERRLAEHADDLDQLQGELSDVTNSLRTYAVHLYLDPEEADDSIRLLKAETFQDAERRRVVTEAIRGDSRAGLSERMRTVKAHHDELRSQAIASRDEARSRQRQREEMFARALSGQAAQRRLQEAWDKKVRAATAGNETLGDVSELNKAIADQRARQARVAPPPISSNGRLVRPVNARTGSPFGYRNGKPHEGVDFPAPTGTPVRAAQGGKVLIAGWSSGGYGNMIVIDHGNGLDTRYAHLSSMSVRAGQSVSQGQTIGAVGNTGDSRGAHLHFETRVNGVARNPMNYLS